MSGPRARRTSQRGNAIVEITWVGILLLVPLLWIVVSVFEVQSGAFGTSSAARAAARAYALAPDDLEGRRRAAEAARLALADQGVTTAPQVRVTCTPYPTNCHSGTSVITVRVDTAVELPLFPEFFGGGAPRFALDAEHTVPIGQFQEVDRAG